MRNPRQEGGRGPVHASEQNLCTKSALPRPPADEIVAVLGHIPADEHEQRRNIRACHVMAGRLIHRPCGPNARSLLWMALDCATFHYLSGHDTDTLGKAAQFCKDLILLADRAAALEVPDGLA